MKTTVNQLKNKVNASEAFNIAICPKPGFIITVNNLFTTQVISYILINGEYKMDKTFSCLVDVDDHLAAMLTLHNNSVENQKEADDFFNKLWK